VEVNVPIEFQPLVSNLIVRLQPEPEVSTVIQVQKSTEGLCRYGEVIAIGPEVRDIKVGQTVLASVTAGVEMADGMLLSESAVLGIVHE
jgi:co-chaperonin GroES (HSP10)